MRRTFTRRAAIGIGVGALAAGVARAAPVVPVGPLDGGAPASRLPRFGALGTVADANGFLLPAGFRSRVVARSGEAVAGTDFVFVANPDGAGVVPQPDGGWWLLWNGEVANAGGGVAALRMDAGGSVIAAHAAVTGLNRACAGGTTPWGTWLVCEEVDRGTVWEVDPTGVRPPAQRLGMGQFAHEAAAVDGARGAVYLSEDERDGFFYRYRFEGTDLATGVLEAAAVAADGHVTWLQVPDPLASTTRCRAQVAATQFHGGEGVCMMDGRLVFLTSKFDDHVWRYDTVTGLLDIVYQPSAGSVLSGVDNISVSPGHDLLVCEDGGNMEVVAVEQDGRAAPLLRLTGQSGSELTGVNVSPDGRRLYVGSQRAISATRGIVYEITGPFPW